MGVGVLTHRQAQVLRYHLLGYSQGEIAEAMGITQPRVSALLSRALEKVEQARQTLEFYEELRYIKELRDRGYREEAILR